MQTFSWKNFEFRKEVKKSTQVWWGEGGGGEVGTPPPSLWTSTLIPGIQGYFVQNEDEVDLPQVDSIAIVTG